MIKIDNKANLPYEVIGRVFDKYIDRDLQMTIFDGMKEYELFNYKRKEYKMTIEYKTTYTKLSVEEVNVLAKKVSMKDVKFPRIPRKKKKY